MPAAVTETGTPEYFLSFALELQFHQLDALLRQEKLPNSPDRWQNAHDLLLNLLDQDRMPQDPAQLCPLLSPLFSRSPREQKQFKALFAQWAVQQVRARQHRQLSAQQPSQPLADPLAQQQPPPPVQDTAPSKSSSTTQTILPPTVSRRRLVKAISGVLLLTALISVILGYWWSNQQTNDAPPILAPSIIRAPILSATPKTQARSESSKQTLQVAPPRTPKEEPVMTPRWRASLGILEALAILLPGSLGILWLLWRWLSWQTVLKRTTGGGQSDDHHDPLHAITLASEQDDLLDHSDLRAALRRLHTPVAFSTCCLDAAASVQATANHAGLFYPVFQQRLMVPDCVFLVNYRHSDDHMAALAELAGQRLHAAGLRVFPYSYQYEPHRVRDSQAGANGRWYTLPDVAAKHPGSRLLLIGEPAVLIDPWTQALQPWTDVLALWPQRGLLATRLPPVNWQQTMQASGLAVSDFSSAGLAELAEHLSGAPPHSPVASVTLPLPAQLQDNEQCLAIYPPPQKQRRELLHVLEQYLNPHGSLLFAAMATYPGLHWGLTRALELILNPDADSETRERRLLRIARLPWCREGHLPEWLRNALLNHRTHEQRSKISKVYVELFSRASIDGTGEIALPFDLPQQPSKRWRRWLSRKRDVAPEHAALRDRIFAQTVLGGQRHWIDFLLPRALAQQLQSAVLALLIPRIFVVGILMSGGVWLAMDGWQHWVQGPLRQALLGWQLAEHGAYEVTVLHNENTQALAVELQETLVKHGFPEPVLKPALTLLTTKASSNSRTTTASDNTVQAGSVADAATATYIAQRLRYLSWGLAPVVANQPAGPVPEDTALQQPPPPGKLRVWLYTPARTGSGFADPLSDALSKEQLRQFGQASIIQDSLRDGGQGPEMVVLGGGTFTMGSPIDEPERRTNEGPQHTVTIASFALGRTEITFDDYDRFARATKRELPDDEGWGRGQRPVINVRWRDAQAYASWLAEQTGYPYRLPSEAEWEYATRAGTTTAFSTGDCINTDLANYNGKVDYAGCGANTGIDRATIVQAGSLPANPWGLHEMHGNVWEWIQDCWHDSYQGAPTDGSAWQDKGESDCFSTVLRGGLWKRGPRFVRSAKRFRGTPDYGGSGIGFRLARTL